MRCNQGPACLSGSKRTFRSFSDIHVWAWHGIYHQALEIARVLRPYFNVTVRFQARSPRDLPRLHRALSGLLHLEHALAHAGAVLPLHCLFAAASLPCTYQIRWLERTCLANPCLPRPSSTWF